MRNGEEKAIILVDTFDIFCAADRPQEPAMAQAAESHHETCEPYERGTGIADYGRWTTEGKSRKLIENEPQISRIYADAVKAIMQPLKHADHTKGEETRLCSRGELRRTKTQARVNGSWKRVPTTTGKTGRVKIPGAGN